MMTKIWAIGILAVLATSIAPGSLPLYLKALEEVEIECEESESTEDYQGGQFNREGVTDNWTDTDDTKDEDIAWIRSEIDRLKERPELRISGTSIHRAEKTVVLGVYERTPENERLHHEMIDGWEIIVAESYEPSISDTFYDIFTNTPILLWILAGCVFLSLVVVFLKYRRRRKERDRSASN